MTAFVSVLFSSVASQESEIQETARESDRRMFETPVIVNCFCFSSKCTTRTTGVAVARGRKTWQRRDNPPQLQ